LELKVKQAVSANDTACFFKLLIMKFPPTYTENKKCVNVVIETPLKSRNKYAYDKDLDLFRLKKVLPLGMAFPCDMGFLPGTRGEDGDPLDVLVFMSDLSYPGCLVECRLLGVIRAEQEEKEERPVRNDRFIAVPCEMAESKELKDISDIPERKLRELADFFKQYNKKENKKFRVLSIEGKARAHALVKRSIKG
jgi:inorganic pyrophosphatase